MKWVSVDRASHRAKSFQAEKLEVFPMLIIQLLYFGKSEKVKENERKTHNNLFFFYPVKRKKEQVKELSSKTNKQSRVHIIRLLFLKTKFINNNSSKIYLCSLFS